MRVPDDSPGASPTGARGTRRLSPGTRPRKVQAARTSGDNRGISGHARWKSRQGGTARRNRTPDCRRARTARSIVMKPVERLALHGVHHTAFPTWKPKSTVDFYRDALGLPVRHAITAKGWGR